MHNKILTKPAAKSNGMPSKSEITTLLPDGSRLLSKNNDFGLKYAVFF